MVWFSSLQTLGKCIHDEKKDYLNIFKNHFRKYLVLGKLYIFILQASKYFVWEEGGEVLNTINGNCSFKMAEIELADEFI